MSNAEKYIREKIPGMVGERHVAGMKLETLIALLNGFHESETKLRVERNHGLCMRCKKCWATRDYNGHDHYVCDHCFKMLENEFEEEYK